MLRYFSVVGPHVHMLRIDRSGSSQLGSRMLRSRYQWKVLEVPNRRAATSRPPATEVLEQNRRHMRVSGDRGEGVGWRMTFRQASQKPREACLRARSDGDRMDGRSSAVVVADIAWTSSECARIGGDLEMEMRLTRAIE